MQFHPLADTQHHHAILGCDDTTGPTVTGHDFLCVIGKRVMSDRRMFNHQALAHQLKFAHELREQVPDPSEILGFPAGLDLDTELAHSPYAQVAAGAIQIMGNSSQSPCITLLKRAL